MDESLIYFKKIVEDNGYKFTKQKKYVLDMMIRSNIHLSAEDVYDKLRVNQNIGLATVYRSLKMFSKLNIMKEINISGVNYYEMKIFSKKPLHIHFKCMACKSIIDIDNVKVLEYLKLNNDIQKDNDIIIYDTDIMLKGLCTTCREDKNVKTNKI